MYYLEDVHSTDLILESAKEHIKLYRANMWRVFNIIIENKLISIYELCRLLNLNFFTNKTINDKLVKIIQELKIMGIDLSHERDLKIGFLVSKYIDNKSAITAIRQLNNKYEEEANILYFAIDKLKERSLAHEITLYRNPLPESLLNKFDAIGYGGWRKKTTIILDCITRRPVNIQDIIGFRERIHSTISKGNFPKPIFCYFIGSSFSEKVMDFALKSGLRLLRLDENLKLHSIESIYIIKEKYEKKYGRLAEAQGIAFEVAVEKVYKQLGYDTERRKKFYIKNNNITESGKKVFTDIDIYAQKNETEIILIECKSSRKQLSRNNLFKILSKHEKISDYLYLNRNKLLKMKIIIIGKINKLDKLEAKRNTHISLIFFTPNEFYNKYKRQIKDEPRWLFTSYRKKLKNDRKNVIQIIKTHL